MITIIDTDALLGLSNPKDAHHAKATLLSMKLSHLHVDIFLLPTVLSEFALMATSRIGMETTKEAVSHLSNEPYFRIPIDEIFTQEAEKLYQKQTSKEESLFDCFVMTGAKKYNADFIFSFDKGYTKNGFTLAEDFVKQREN